MSPGHEPRKFYDPEHASLNPEPETLFQGTLGKHVELFRKLQSKWQLLGSWKMLAGPDFNLLAVGSR